MFTSIPLAAKWQQEFHKKTRQQRASTKVVDATPSDAEVMMRGGSILVLQRIPGHTDIKVTMRYAYFVPDHLNEATLPNSPTIL
ncbi:hypothetical protein CES92_20500 [Enterobacter roggenkampii]|nr:hypothetical protein CES92_20500 [Enterobacter roggenkampii]